MNAIKTVLLVLVALVFFQQCGVKPDSQGEFDEIYVFADSLDWLEYEDAIRDIFAKEYRTPVLEPEYLVKWRPFERFDTYKKFRNIFFLARLNSEEPVSANVKALLSEEIIQGVMKGDYFYIPKKDVWALEQYVLFLVAPTKEDMIQRIYDFGDVIYQDFERSYYQRLKRFVYARYENKELEEYIRTHFPFTIRVQHDYFLADESLEEGYVWLRRLNPDRSLFVHWVPYTEDMQITPRWIIDERNRLAAKIYEGDVVVEEETFGRRITFKGFPAYRLEGTWKNPKYIIGGPFRNITFVDKENRIVFMIDFYVQAIGQRKKVFLDQLEVMAYTFQENLGKKEDKMEEAAE
ncbi:MAG: DUF4837 family protein [Calditrichaeota bacterium]|nr:DUF4837 family protein [Calditrichota bacterium]